MGTNFESDMIFNHTQRILLGVLAKYPQSFPSGKDIVANLTALLNEQDGDERVRAEIMQYVRLGIMEEREFCFNNPDHWRPSK